MEQINKNHILIVDDMEVNRVILGEMFNEQYSIIEASDGKEALGYIEKHSDQIAIILLDILMPVMDGFEVLGYMQENGLIERIPVVMITSELSSDSDNMAYEYGVADIIKKPFERNIVMRRVKNIIDLYQHKENLEKKLHEQEKILTNKNKELMENQDFLVEALSSVVEFRSVESGDHIKRIKYYTKILCICLSKYYPEYNMDRDMIDRIVSASALHDIGKIGIPDSILLKPGKLTTKEFEIMKTHTTIGCQILEQFARNSKNMFCTYCYEICRYHHERWDGGGYPDKLKGYEIPISAQIVAVADVYDALVSKRVYKDEYTPKDAMDMINNGECGVFSPIALECFNRSKEEFMIMAEKFSSN